VLATREASTHIIQNLIDNRVKYGNNTPVSVRARAGSVGAFSFVGRDRGSRHSGGP